MGGLGIFCGLKLKEPKSARTFLALGGALVSVNFAQLAGLTYSLFHQANVIYPAYLHWQAPSVGALLLAAGIGIPTLAILSMASFSALAREIRLPLLGSFLLLNLLLLVPIRDPSFTGLLAFSMATTLAAAFRQVKGAPVAKTFDGRIALAHLFLPVMIVVGARCLLIRD